MFLAHLNNTVTIGLLHSSQRNRLYNSGFHNFNFYKTLSLAYMFLIQECLNFISEHKLQQMEDPNFLESSVWQWNPSSTLLITDSR